MSARKIIKESLRLSASSIGLHSLPLFKNRLWILMYHRILPTTDPRLASEEPGMAVTPDSFRMHINTIKESFEIVSLNDWLERHRTGKTLPLRACAITFDDGWADNFQYAFPILEETASPATVFAVADMMGTQRSFWPNRIARIVRTHQHLMKDMPEGLWLANAQRDSNTPDRESISAAIAHCKQHTDEFIENKLDLLEKALKIAPPASADLMNWDQLRTMVKSNLIEVGSHTLNHRRLVATLKPATLESEIIDSKRKIEEQLDREVDLFCYPNGDISDQALSLVRQHYKAAVSTKRGINKESHDPHRLTRIGIHEDAANSRTRLRARLSGWQ